jgi:hypothetical protein
MRSLLLTVLVLASALGARAQDRVYQGQADLDTALVAFVPAEQAFTPVTRDAFVRAVRELRDSVGVFSDNEIIVRLARAVALADNAYTRTYLLRNRSVLRRYPIRV